MNGVFETLIVVCSLLVPLLMAPALRIGIALWITSDLDSPRQGFLQLSDAPLQALRFDTPEPGR